MQSLRHFRTSTYRLIPLAALCTLAGCGSGDGFPSAGGPLQATFGSIQANIFTPICEHCHSGATAPAGLRLDAANSYALLVGVASVEDATYLRVQPHDPNNSYLIKKLEGTAAVGERMPAGLPPLSSADINVIRQWITDGALPDAPATQPVRVSSLAPLPGNDEAQVPASIMAVFDRDVDASTVNPTTFLLERSGGDGTFGNGNDVAIVPVSVTVPAANPRSAVMSLMGVTSAIDTYRVTLLGDGAAAIRDLQGNALDGEFTNVLPSGNGTAGGTFTAQFRVIGVQPTLLSIQTNVFTPICSACHTGTGAQLPGSMNLTSVSASFANLVGVASVEMSTLQRVTAANADNSYLIRKLEGGPNIVGARMPIGAAVLDQATINAIRQWITNGAPQQ